MSMFRRKQSTHVDAPASTDDTEPVSTGSVKSAPKGRPTPKRRTTATPAAPAPRTRKEAMAWQKQHGARATVAGQQKLSPAEYRQAVRSGEVLPRRDQGPVRALARDYVDSRRMASNYLLWLFLLLLLGLVVPVIQYVTLLLFFGLVLEWIYSGSRIKKLAAERGHTSRESALSLGFYAGSRAYFRRSWRRPLPVVELGDKI
jgi:hypothetical protein